MRTDEQIEDALEDADDLRPLLLAASGSELKPIYEAAGIDRRANEGELAEAIDLMIDGELGGGGHGGLQLRLSAWAARLLGAEAEPMDLATADRQILLRTKHGALYETTVPGGGASALLVIAVNLARLRKRKLGRLRFWKPLLNIIVPVEGDPTEKESAAPVEPDILDATIVDAATKTESAPGAVAQDAQAADDGVWETIRKAGGAMPLAIWEERLTQARKDLGRFNIIVAGRTGVGKTTLIGAIFGQEVGNTLMGRPRTRGCIWYPEEPGDGDILRLCDTEGLEMERYTETLSGLKSEIERANSSNDPFDHIHVAWLCIDEPSLTVQPGEEALTAMLVRENIPLIVALTKSGMAPDFRDEVQRLLPDAQAVIRVRARPIEMEGQIFAPLG
ncbi:MAG: GTPase domain-containing protein, partial [Hyphomicrobiales bacterium]|nr:GTPase domain-containing protein [Hyphomicrobiales bacterium]